MTCLLSEREVSAALDPPRLVDELARYWRGSMDVETAPRAAMRHDGGCWLGVSRAWSRQLGLASTKIATEAVHGSRTTGDSLLTLTDLQTGEILVAMKAETLTQLRTAASTVAVARVLGRGAPESVTVIGSGHLAAAHLLVLRETVPFRRLVVCARSRGAAAALLERTGVCSDPRVETEEDIEEAVAEAGLVVTATAAREPFLRGEWLANGTHVAAVGAFDATTNELRADVFARAGAVLVDDVGGALLAGDVHAALERGATSSAALTTPDRWLGRGDVLRPDRVTVWKSVGSAGQDLVAGWLAWQGVQTSTMGGSDACRADRRT